MGSKKNKLKKVFSPQSKSPPPPPLAQDDDLMDDLLAQLDSRDQAVRQESANVIREVQHTAEEQVYRQQDSKSRYQARQARKAATLAEAYSAGDPEADARLEREAKEEEKNIKRICDELGVQMFEARAFWDQLALLSILPSKDANYATVRLAACNYMYSHPDDFLPFLPSADGEDGPGAQNAGLMSFKEYERYCQSIRDTAMWGGEPEILALSRAFNVPIHVVQSGTPPVVVHNPTGTPLDGDIRDTRVVRISYHRRMYGLGEHYNSLRPKSLSQSIQNVFS
ncbi:amidohydrolase family protein [Moniliophthora roreri]|uniref:OTU domain-containing protein n=1 Tax=Moniliophthora roreri TaxID=221103 RepID=A0A0W0F928_MONRR|nr:amidohydrolase family protein [Moniliophthora roreri]